MTASASKKTALPNGTQILKRRTERLGQSTPPSRSERRISVFDCVPTAVSETRIQTETNRLAMDLHPRKLDLTAKGFSVNGMPYRFNAISEAEKRICGQNLDKEYTLVEGLEQFNVSSMELLLGKGHRVVKEGTSATVQAMSGTGALRLGAEFIRHWMQGRIVFISDPTWKGHRSIFSDAGIPCKNYRYLHERTLGLHFEGMMDDLMAAPDESVILLQGCAHSPTGVDPSHEQWNEIADVCLQKRHLPFFDVAFQGLASGCIDRDAYAPRMFVDKGLKIMVAQSFSKNMGLHNECISALNLVLHSRRAAQQALIDMKRVASGLHAFPAVRGARLVAEIVQSPDLEDMWRSEVAGIVDQVSDVRGELCQGLLRSESERDWSFVSEQLGIFTQLHLTPSQIEMLRRGYHVYLTSDGCVALSGLPTDRVEYLTQAVAEVRRRISH